MEIHQLVYFVAVAETGGFSRAAERCNVAQPSLSQQIMKLEQELGHALFDRLGRRVTLTDAGALLLPRARQVLSDLQSLKSEMLQDLDMGHGALSVGFIPTIAPFVLPRVIQRFSERFPHARLSVHEDLTQMLVRALIEGRLDLAVMSLPIQNRLVETHELLAEPFVVAFSRHYHGVDRIEIRVKELERFPFIALSEMHCLGEQVQSFCHQQNLALNVVCHTAQLTTVQSCIALGIGVSLVPQALASTDRSGQVLYQALVDAAPQRKIAAATRAGRPPSRLAREVMQMVREEYPGRPLLS